MPLWVGIVIGVVCIGVAEWLILLGRNNKP